MSMLKFTFFRSFWVKFFLVFLVGVSFWSSVAWGQSRFAPVFSDVTVLDPNYEAISWLAKQGVIGGYPDGGFHPDSAVNRVELLKMVYLAKGLGDEVLYADLVGGFPDTDLSQWYAPYVIYARKNGTIEGYPDGTFRPGEAVNRAEALKIVLREFFSENDFASVSGQLPYVDAGDGSDWYYNYLVFGFEKCLLDRGHEQGVEEGKIFGLGQPMSRQEVAEFLYRAKALRDRGLENLCGGDFSPPDDLTKVRAVDFALPGLFFVAEDSSLQRLQLKINDTLLFFLGMPNELSNFVFVPSSDGKRLISLLPISATSNDATAIYVSNIDGTYKLQLFDNSPWPVDQAVWSFDNDFVVWKYRESGAGSVVKIGIYGVGSPLDSVRTFEGEEGYDYRLLGMLGDRIYVLKLKSGTEDVGTVGYFRFDAFRGEWDGAFSRLFVNEPGVYSDYAFSDDASQLVYVQTSGDRLALDGFSYLYYRDLSNPGQKLGLVTTKGDAIKSPVWSHDGKYLFYLKGFAVWRMELATREEMLIADAGLVESFFEGVAGARILFVSSDGRRLGVWLEGGGARGVIVVGANKLNLFEDVEKLGIGEELYSEGMVSWIE